MPDLEQNNQPDFLRETIKVKPVNKRKLLRRTILTASMAVIFGLIACFTFLILEPVLNKWLYPEEPIQNVVFPEDPEEMSPEDMLAEKEEPEETIRPAEPTFSPPSVPVQPDEEAEQELMEKILAGVVLDRDNYVQLYDSMSDYINELNRSMVTVTAITVNLDWFLAEQESRNQSSGVIISENGKELLILTTYSAIESAENLLLTFYDGSVVPASLKQYMANVDLAVIAVELDLLPDTIKSQSLPIADLGVSNKKNIAGTPVVAMGCPMGVCNSVGYGIITSNGTVMSTTDKNYKLFLTDIAGSKDANGVLFDFHGRIIGVITNDYAISDVEGMITFFGITELKKMIEKMSNADSVAYLGITGMDVTKEINAEMNVPIGAYVTKIEFDSPAMRAGIQPGDVIVGMNDKMITTFNNYSNELMMLDPGQPVTLKIMRQVMNEYKEIEFIVDPVELKDNRKQTERK